MPNVGGLVIVFSSHMMECYVVVKKTVYKVTYLGKMLTRMRRQEQNHHHQQQQYKDVVLR